MVFRVIAILFSIATLVSCGSDGKSNHFPLAEAGEDQVQIKDRTVYLDGSNSIDPDGDPLEYRWFFSSVPEGSLSVLSDSTSVRPNFTPDCIGKYVINLVVTDGFIESEINSTTIIINKIIIYENNFDEQTLGDFVLGLNGGGQVYVDNGQLRIIPGTAMEPVYSYMNRSYASIDISKISKDYNANIYNDGATIAFSYNVSNYDGAYNNALYTTLSNNSDLHDKYSYGYLLLGGGNVGSRMYFAQYANTYSTYGNIYNIIFDLYDGLETLPTIGAIKLTFDTKSSVWKFYYEEGLEAKDPLTITSLIGEAANGSFNLMDLPFFVLGSQTTGGAFFDNLKIMLVYDIR